MYDLTAHGEMINDSVRTGSYARALRETVTPESVVLDIGTGTGIFALLACQFGAKKVYAVESADVIEVAREIAVANGFERRIEFIEKTSMQVNLPEPVSLITSDIRGVLPLCGQSIRSIIDARDRLLIPNGTLIPDGETLWAAPVDTPGLYRPVDEPWVKNQYGLNLTPARRLIENTPSKGRVMPDESLASPQCLFTLDYNRIKNPNLNSQSTFTLEKGGTVHGFSVWFDSSLTADISFSNSPSSPKLVYGSAFFPLTEALSVEKEDVITVDFSANLVGSDYIWNWRTKLFTKEYLEKPAVSYSQSTFFSQIRSSARLRKTASTYVPKLNQEGSLRKVVLSMIDGHSSVEHISRALTERYPDRFPEITDALTEVGKLCQKYSE